MDTQAANKPIVVGVDGSRSGTEALRWALAEAEWRDCGVRALLVAHLAPVAAAGRPTTVGLATSSAGETGQEYVSLLQENLRAVLGHHDNPRLSAEVVRGGPPDVLSAAFAGGQLLVLGSHGHGWLSEAVPGSVASYCLRQPRSCRRHPGESGHTGRTGRDAPTRTDELRRNGGVAMRACDVMTTPVVTVTPEATVRDSARLLAAKGFTAIPVVDDDDCLIGIVTEADLVRDRFPRDVRYRRHTDQGSPPGPPGASVGDVMTSPVTAMGANTDVADLVTAMWDGRVRSMPIVDGSRVVGIVTRRDLVRIVGRADQAIATDVRNRLANYGGADRWTVAVHDGVASLGEEYEDEAERHVARVIAEAVPGAVAAHVVPVRH